MGFFASCLVGHGAFGPFPDIALELCYSGLLFPVFADEAVRGESVRDPDIFDLDIVLDLAVGVGEGGLAVDGGTEIKRETPFLGVLLNHFGNVHHHCLLNQLGRTTELTSRSYLQVRTLGRRVVQSKVLVQPNPGLALGVDPYHRVKDLEEAHLLVAVLKPSVGFAEEVEGLWQDELGQLIEPPGYSLGDDFHGFCVAAERSFSSFDVFCPVDLNQGCILVFTVEVDFQFVVYGVDGVQFDELVFGLDVGPQVLQDAAGGLIPHLLPLFVLDGQFVLRRKGQRLVSLAHRLVLLLLLLRRLGSISSFQAGNIMGYFFRQQVWQFFLIMSGLGNIYYVGRTTSPSPYIRQPLFSAYRGRKHLQSASSQNCSRSTSCPKTQRSRYMKSIDQMKTMTPSYRHNEMMTRKAMLGSGNKEENREKQNEERWPVKIRREEERGKNTSKQSSAFRTLLPKKDVAKEVGGERAGKVIRFRKVQQPTKQKHVHWKTQNQFRLHSLRLKPGSALEGPPLRLQLIPPQDPRRIDSNLQLSRSSSQQQPVPSQYKLQPQKKLFLCARCYQFTPMIELKSHHLNCKIPLRKEEFSLKWQKLIALLEECYREEENNALYRLTDRMKGYLREGEGEHNRREGYILYSEQLACILSLKGNVRVSCLREEDLFWLIETLGDLIETKSEEIDESAFWKICT